MAFLTGSKGQNITLENVVMCSYPLIVKYFEATYASRKCCDAFISFNCKMIFLGETPLFPRVFRYSYKKNFCSLYILRLFVGNFHLREIQDYFAVTDVGFYRAQGESCNVLLIFQLFAVCFRCSCI